MMYLIKKGLIPDGQPGSESQITFYGSDGKPRLCSVNQLLSNAPTPIITTRTTLNSDRIYYLSPSGSDSNDALTSNNPGRKLQSIANRLKQIDPNGYSVEIRLAAGAYDGAIFINSMLDGGRLRIVGDTNNPTNVLINQLHINSTSRILTFEGGKYYLEGVTLELASDLAQGTNWNNYIAWNLVVDGFGTDVEYNNLRIGRNLIGITAINGGLIRYGNTTFAAISRAYELYAEANGVFQRRNASAITMARPNSNSGNNSHIRGNAGGIFFTGSNVTYTGNSNCTGGSANLKYNLYNSVIYRFGNPVNDFPGSGQQADSTSAVI